MLHVRRPLFARILLSLLALVTLLLLAGVRADIPVDALLPKYASPASKFVTLDGVSVHYRDEGAGSPLVLIHGTSSSLHTWDAWVERMKGAHRIVRLDLPGFGLTGPAPDRDYRVARNARLVVALLDRLGIDAADIAGNSLGGRIAATIAMDYPERVHKLVLLDASGMQGHKPPLVFALARTPVIGNVLRWVTPRSVVSKNVEQVYGDPLRITESLLDRYYDLTLRAGNRDALVDRFRGPREPDLDARLGEIRAETLILWGEADRWIPLPFGNRLHAGIHGSRLITYPGVGHVPMEELPERTADDVTGFLDTSPTAAIR